MSRHGGVRSWQPLLPPDDAGLALAVAEEIAAEIAADLQRKLDLPGTAEPLPMGRAPFSLSGGWAGQALLFAYLDRACPGRGYGETAAELLEQAFEEVGRSDAQVGLYAGLTGVAWAVEHLRDELVEEGEDPGEPIAERLAQLLAIRPWPLEYDLISGLIGFGVHALERQPLPVGADCVHHAVSRLAEIAERGPGGITWRTHEAVLSPQLRMGAPEGHYNLGTAHGIPGVIGWLGQVCASGLDIGEARSLLAGAVPWLLRQQNPPGSPSRFPIAVVPGEEGTPSGLAWCYGDLGIAAALLTAARGADEPEWERAAVEVAQDSALRSASADVTCAGICHGAAGNAHLFNRLWQATGDPVFAAAARLWLQRALALRRPGEGLAGFRTFIANADGENGWRRDPGFLTGAAGVGLVLLAAATPVEPAWDRLLLAS